MGEELLTSMLTRTLKLIAPAALMASLVFGQTTTTTNQPNPPTIAERVANRVAHYTTLLDLTTAQQSAATTIFTTELTGLDNLRSSMQTAHTALQTAIKSNTGLSAAATQIGNLTAQETLIQATASAAFWAILTPDQQSKIGVLGLQGGPGRGGPGGRGRGRGQGGPPPGR
jgi:Spy/CpxP family protein refolding chaperone